MHTKILLGGKKHDEGWDFVRVERLSASRYQVSGAIAHAGGAVFTNSAFATLEEAKAAGMAWAAEQGCEILYLEMPST